MLHKAGRPVRRHRLRGLGPRADRPGLPGASDQQADLDPARRLRRRHSRRRVHRWPARGGGRPGPDHPGGDRRGRRLRPGPAFVAAVLRRGRPCLPRLRRCSCPGRLLRHDLRPHPEGGTRQHHRCVQAGRGPGAGLDGRADHRLQRVGGRPDRHAAADQVDRPLCPDGGPRHAARAGQRELPGPRLRRQRRPPRADRPGRREGKTR